MALHEQDNTQSSGTTYHYHLDHLGTPRELTDSDGKIVWSARYRAYGNLALADVEEIDNPLRFQGQYFDAETGLHYNLNRYYDPNAGRFIHQDPIGLDGGANVYQYVHNPVNWIDPLGLTGIFSPSVFTAPSGNTHTVYQQNIDWDLPVNTRSGIKTNLDLALEGKSPFLIKDGKYSQMNLHHSKQDSLGSLFEISSDTHQKYYNTNALHPHLPNAHPINPVDRDSFNIDRDAYWRERAKSELERRKMLKGCG